GVRLHQRRWTMRVAHIELPAALAPIWEPRFQALMTCGITPIAAPDGAALRARLAEDDCGGVLHIVDGSDMSPDAILGLATEHSERISVLSGSTRGVAAEFAGALRASEAELLIVLEDFNDVSVQLR